MIFDTNRLVELIRKDIKGPSRLVIPIVIVGKLEAFALKSDWGIQKVNRMNSLFSTFPIADITLPITKSYALIDAFSQGKLDWLPDNDFDHLTALGLRLIKY